MSEAPTLYVSPAGKAVKTVLNDPEWVDWSDSALAEMCNVSRDLIATVRKEENLPGSTHKKSIRYGKPLKMDTSEIGKRCAKLPEVTAATSPIQSASRSIPLPKEILQETPPLDAGFVSPSASLSSEAELDAFHSDIESFVAKLRDRFGQQSLPPVSPQTFALMDRLKNTVDIYRLRILGQTHEAANE